ncbi:MAG: hemerythrin domain-containing protein [Bacteroidia bacterium]
MSNIYPPIKRHERLQPLSREHHQGLLLCWKIRTGIDKNIDLTRIAKYCDYFFEAHIIPHFEAEEKFVFPILGFDNELIKKAVQDHIELKKLFKKNGEGKEVLQMIEKKLEDHIRFEERVLFNEIQEIASKDDLEKIAKLEKVDSVQEGWSDRFWA